MTKTWVDDGDEHESITVHLFADGEEIDSAVITKADGWKYTFENLPKYKDGVEIDYTITEDGIDGYETVIDGYDITNTKIKDEDRIDDEVTIRKVDENGDALDGAVFSIMDGDDVIRTFLAGEYVISTTDPALAAYLPEPGEVTNLTVIEVKAPAGYTGDDSAHNLTISASAEEELVNGVYVTTVTYLMSIDEVDEIKVVNERNEDEDDVPDQVVIRKVGEEGKPLEGAEFTVYNGEEAILTVTGGVTTITTEDLADYLPEAGKVTTLKVKETKAPVGYEPSAETYELVITAEAEEKLIDDVYTTITTYHMTLAGGSELIVVNTPILTEIPVEKVWEDADDQDGIRPESVKVELLADGKPVDEIELNKDNNWKHTFEKLPKYNQGVEIEYTVREIDVPAGYDAIVDGDAADGFTITNLHVPETTYVTVRKVWDDADDNDGKRPEEITVILLADGEALYNVTLTEEEGWTKTFYGLPASKDGAVISYSWSEEEVPEGYTLYSIETEGFITTVTNTYTPETTETTVRKVWSDLDNRDGKQPEQITVELRADGTAIGTEVLSQENNWTATRTGLRKYKDGTAIIYTWAEIDVPAGYKAELTIVDGVTVITNVYLTGSLSVTKQVTGAPESEADKTFEFVIRNAEGKYVKADGSLSDTEVRHSLKAGETLTITPVAIGFYTVTELGTEPDGAAQIVNYTLMATQTGNGTVTVDTPAAITLKNDYTENLGSLSITKAFCGIAPDAEWDEEALAKLTFTVTGPNGYNESFTFADFDVEALDGNLTRAVLTLHNLPIGTYTVTETNAEGIVLGYTLQVSSVTTDTVNVTYGGTATAVLKNNYKKDTGRILLSKNFSITGADGTAVDPQTMTNTLAALAFRVTGENYDKTFYYAQFTDGVLVIDGLVPGVYTVTETNAGELIARYTLVADESDTNGTVTLVRNEDGTVDDVALTLTNVYTADKGSLRVTKTVEGAPEDAADKEFTFTVRNAEGQYIALDGTASDTEVLLTIRGGETVTIDNLPVGRYTVTELLDSTVIANYTLTSESITGGDAVVTLGETAEVALKNVYEPSIGGVRVTKLAIGAPEGMEFRIALKDTEGNYYQIDGSIATEDNKWVTLKDGESATWTNLPIGTYVVEEDDASVEGLNLTVTGIGEVQVVSDTITTDTVVNNYTEDLGRLIVKKTFTGLPEGTNVNELAFHITGPNGYDQTVYYIQFTDGIYVIENLPLGEYTVTETNAEGLVLGYTLMTTSVTTNSGEITKGDEIVVELTNNYQKDVGSLTIEKNFEGVPEGTDVSDLTFVITGPGGYSLTLTYAQFTDGKYVIENLPVGEYTVTETNADGLIANYTLSVDSQTDGVGTVVRNENVTVTLTNIYEPRLGSLIIEKLFYGLAVDTNVDGLTFIITGPDGFSLTVSYDEFVDGIYELNDLPVGVYTVTELNGDDLLVQYVLQTESVTTDTVSITDDYVTRVRLVNVYARRLANLVIHKTFIGVPEGVSVDGLIFRITGPDGFAMNVPYASFDEDGTFTLEGVPYGTYTVTELNAEGLVVSYELQADSVTTDTTDVNGNDGYIELVNHYEPALGALTIRKTFTGVNDFDAESAKNLVFRILGPDGFDITVTYAEFTNGTYTIENLKPGTYLVYELNAMSLNPSWTLLATSVTAVNTTVVVNETSTVDLQNNYEIARTSASIMKVWNDMDDLDGSRPESLTVHLMNGNNVVATVVLNEHNGWYAEVNDLPLYDDEGNIITYTWAEDNVNGYELTNQVSMGNVTVITNTHIPELVNVTVLKIWEDNNNVIGMRPTKITVTLYNGGTAVTTVELNEQNSWCETVTDLPKYIDGTECNYYWREQEVLGYTLTNTRTVGYVTTLTNTFRTRPTTDPNTPTPPRPGIPTVVIDDYDTPLGIDVMINHVGDCFD